MSTFRGRALSAAIISSTIVLMLAGCSGGAGTSTSEPTSTSAVAFASASAEETTATGGDATEEFIDRFSAGIEAMTTMAFTMEITTAGQTITGSGEMDNSTTPPTMAMEMTIPGSGTPIKTILADDVQYINMGEATGNMWMKVDAATGAGLGTSADPLEQLRAFRTAVTSVTEVGQEDINGIASTRYSVTIDTAKMDVPAEQAAVELPPEVTYDLWLDDKGRTTQLSMDLTVAGVQTATVMTFSKIGEPVSIEAPPADQITEMDSLE